MHNSIRTFKRNKNQDSYSRVLNSLRLLNDADADFRFTIRVNYDDKVIDHIEPLINDIAFLNKKKALFPYKRFGNVIQTK